MKKRLVVLLVLVVGLVATAAHAREVNSFTVSDGQASYNFVLAETGMKLFYYSYQDPSVASMKSRVFAYEPLGPAPLDNPVMRAEIANKVRWLFLNEMVHLDTMHPVDMPNGAVCYSAILNADGSCNLGIGLKFKTKDGTIQRVEAADSSCCASEKSFIEEYESHKPGNKAKKRK
jgi:hypothetical protein